MCLKECPSPGPDTKHTIGRVYLFGFDDADIVEVQVLPVAIVIEKRADGPSLAGDQTASEESLGGHRRVEVAVQVRIEHRVVLDARWLPAIQRVGKVHVQQMMSMPFLKYMSNIFNDLYIKKIPKCNQQKAASILFLFSHIVTHHNAVTRL